MLQRADPRPTVLLTGFGPFPGVDDNASGDLARNLARIARRSMPGIRFAVSVLPTEWTNAPRRVAALHRRYRPVLALHFGVARGAQNVRLETQARNFCRAAPDAAGVLPAAASLCEDGPAERRATIAVQAIAKELDANGHLTSISDDAGGYLCNAVLYHSLAQAEGRGGCQVGFVHIPSDLSEAPLRMSEATAAALKIIKIALESASAT